MKQITNNGLNLQRGMAKTVIKLLFAFGVIPITVLSVIFFGFYVDGRKQDIMRIQQEIARRIADNVTANIEKIRTSIEQIGEISGFISLEPLRLHGICDRLIERYPNIDTLSFIDKNGNEILKSSRYYTFLKDEYSNVSETSWFKNAGFGNISIEQIGKLRFSGFPGVRIAVPLKNFRGGIIGVFSAELDATYFRKLLSKKMMGRNRSAYIVDQKGIVVVHQKLSIVLKKTDFTCMPSVRWFSENKTGVFEYEKPDRTRVIGATANIAHTGWGVIVEEPVDTAFRGFYILTGILICIFLLTLFLAVALGIKFSMQRIILPLRKLREEALSIAEGHLLEGRIRIETGDELEQLATAFNEMVSNLKTTTVSRDLLIREIEERRQIEKALRESEENYRSIFDSVNEVIFIHDPETGGIIDTNKNIAEMFGYSHTEVVELGFKCISPEIPGFNIKEAEKKIRTAWIEGPQLFEWKAKHRNGHLFWTEVNLKRAVIGGKEKVIAVVRDITERKEAAERIKRQNLYLKALNETVGALIERKDENTLLKTVILQAGELLSSKNGFIYLHDPETDELVLHFACGIFDKHMGLRIKKGEGLSGKVFANGLPIIIEDYENWDQKLPIYQNDPFKSIIAVPLKSNDEVSGVIGLASLDPEVSFSREELDILIRLGDIASIASDNARLYQELQVQLITRKRIEKEKEKVQEQLYQKRKNEAIGTLAGGIAHNFNNLLMAIQGNVSLLHMILEKNHSGLKRVEVIEDCIQKGAKLTKQLLAFAKTRPHEAIPENINNVVKLTAEMFGSSRKDLRISSHLKEEIWMTDVNQGKLEQVLINILLNSGQAMPSGGNIDIRTDNIQIFPMEAETLGIEKGRYSLIEIKDTGNGMDEYTLQQVFNPFFTTRDLSQSSGLGLSTAFGYVKDHGGTIKINSRPGMGTTVSIFLPASKEKHKPIERISMSELPMGRENILLVDDEITILDVGRQLLEHLGYSVITAKNGKEALKVFRAHMDQTDLVILDMIMPDMNGPDVFKELTAIDPDIRVLFSSGYDFAGRSAGKLIEKGIREFIQKPFDIGRLSKAIRRILDSEKRE